jgi:hypothetical protein
MNMKEKTMGMRNRGNIWRTVRIFLFSFLSFHWASAQAATYYVSDSGSNFLGNGSLSSPWATISHGISRLSGGDTLIVRPGTYTGSANFINTRMVNIPGGTSSAYTTIKAEIPFTARIRNSGALNYYDSMVYLQRGANYIHVDGFIFDMANTSDPEYIATIESNYNKITRSVFRREGSINEYGGWVAVYGSYNLIEDCAGVGAARYGFFTGGPNSSASYNIFRRCVGRVDYSNSNQPKATFAAYGNNSGNNMHDVIFQNCVALDGRRGPTGGEDTYGGYYFPKNATNITVQGGIVLNNEAGHAGYFVKELQGQNIRVEHSIAWGIWGTSGIVGFRTNGSAPGPLVFDHVTVGETPGGYYNRDSASTRILQNSLFYNNSQLASGGDFGWTTLTHNAFTPASQAQGSFAITSNIGLKHIVRAESGSALSGAGNDGLDAGANVIYRYGVSGTLWGQAGYNQLTTEPLWPWPYEAQIKAVFSESNTPPPGNVPDTNNTARGFCANTDQFGQTMTLTRYIWQYLGNKIPTGFYGSSPIIVQPPTGLSGTVLP